MKRRQLKTCQVSFERYAQIQEHSKSPKEWIENYSVYALEDHKFNERAYHSLRT